MSDAFRIRAVRAIAGASSKLYRALDTSARVRVGDASIVVPISHGIGLRNLHFQPVEMQFVALLGSLLAQRPGAVLDVGANIGRFLMYVVAADSRRAYVGFEPLLAGCGYIEKLIAQNELPRHTVIPVALSNQAGVVRLWHNTTADVCATTTTGFYGDSYYRGHSVVPSVVGDAMVDALDVGPIALVKVDVEGGELEVLQGLTQTVARNRPFLVVEVIPPLAKDAVPELAERRRGRIAEMQALLEGWQYEPYKISAGNRLIRRTGQLDPGASVDVHEMDYLCVPRELATGIESRGLVTS